MNSGRFSGDCCVRLGEQVKDEADDDAEGHDDQIMEEAGDGGLLNAFSLSRRNAFRGQDGDQEADTDRPKEVDRRGAERSDVPAPQKHDYDTVDDDHDGIHQEANQK